MSKPQLLTDWLCIATAGYTVDGREITEQELIEMAESYDPNVYTALIWLEHYRYFGNLGRVHEVKVDKVEGKTKLFARISPTTELMALNGQGQKLFFSVEIKPDFQRTGKNYLFGLAVTDTPASTGTTALNFSAKGVNETLLLGNAEPMHFTVQDNEDFTLYQAFKRFFGIAGENRNPKEEKKEPILVNPDNEHNKEENFSMKPEELKTVIAEAVAAAFAAQKQVEQPQDEGTKAEAATVSAEAFNALKADFEALQKQFAEMSKEKTPVPHGANPAIADQAEKFTVTTAV